MSDEATLLDVHEAEPGVQVVTLLGELDYSNLPEVRDHVYGVVSQAHGVVIDVRKLKFIDSNGLGFILQVHRRMHEKAGRMVLVSTSSHMEKLLRISGLEAVLPVHADEASAVAAVKGG
ncbi:MAG TPA: STAS domain-containing protein [Candidatus Xenobia bacterium]|jgi:anti-sigma B factor antagonist